MTAVNLIASDAIAFRGDYLIHGVDFWPMLRPALDHLRRMDLRRAAPISEADKRLYLLAAIPCYLLEHRHGICPLGLDHGVVERAGHNTIVTSLKKSTIDQFTNGRVGATTPLSLQVTYVSTGTSSAATLASDTQLGAEYYRDTPTYISAVTDLQGQIFWYFGPGVANAGSSLQEWGMMAGGATSTPGDGTMVARFLQVFAKNIGTAANGQYTINVA